ncbi:Mediator complex subunit Med21 [Gracilaria domingensis]|nr:Mediator complex subunit Med21 [Gracilaria domingensis]
MDDLSRLQKKLEELGVKFYECLGVLQRDAPPTSRAPDEKEEVANDEAARKRLASQIPEFATDIVKCSRDVDALIDVIEGKMKQQEGQERSLLDTANFESNQAGEEMVDAVDDAQKLLTSVRNLIAARERES